MPVTGIAMTHTARIGTIPASFSLPWSNRVKSIAGSIAGSIPACPQIEGVTATAMRLALKRV